MARRDGTALSDDEASSLIVSEVDALAAAVDPLLSVVMSNSVTTARRQRADAERVAFTAWLAAPTGLNGRRTWQSHTNEDCRRWMWAVFKQPRPDLRLGFLATVSVQGKASALDHARRRANLMPFMSEERTLGILRAMRAERPAGRVAPPLPRAPMELVQFLPRDDSFSSTRLRALFGVRTAAMLRSGAPADIVLTSIKVARSPAGLDVVVFRLATKASRLAGVVSAGRTRLRTRWLVLGDQHEAHRLLFQLPLRRRELCRDADRRISS